MLSESLKVPSITLPSSTTNVGTIQSPSAFCSWKYKVISKGCLSFVSSSWILYLTYMSCFTPSPGYQRSSPCANALLVPATADTPSTSNIATNAEAKNLEAITKIVNGATDKCLFYGINK